MAAIPTVRPLQLQTCRGQEVQWKQSFLAKIFLKEKEKHPGRRWSCGGGQLSHGLILKFKQMSSRSWPAVFSSLSLLWNRNGSTTSRSVSLLSGHGLIIFHYSGKLQNWGWKQPELLACQDKYWKTNQDGKVYSTEKRQTKTLYSSILKNVWQKRTEETLESLSG